MALSVTLYQSGYMAHTSLVITGLLILQEQGKINLTIQDCRGLEGHPDLNMFMTKVDVDGEILWFDTGDGYAYDPEKMRKINDFYAQGAFIFRRSYAPQENQRCFPQLVERIFPLGMNYFVNHPQNPIQFDHKRVKLKEVLRRLAGFKPDEYFTCNVFEHPANPCQEDPLILFYARLWEPSPVSHIYDEQNEAISNDRIQIVRLLKKEFPKTFTGGIYDTKYAKKKCKDLIVSKYHARRENFLQLIKKNDICIATRGLSESTGWKTAEYVAASRAIVSERLRFSSPGTFSDGVNFLSFENPDECVSRVVSLCRDPERIWEMKRANEAYYKEYMRPDRQMWHALQVSMRLTLAAT